MNNSPDQTEILIHLHRASWPLLVILICVYTFFSLAAIRPPFSFDPIYVAIVAMIIALLVLRAYLRQAPIIASIGQHTLRVVHPRRLFETKQIDLSIISSIKGTGPDGCLHFELTDGTDWSTGIPSKAYDLREFLRALSTRNKSLEVPDWIARLTQVRKHNERSVCLALLGNLFLYIAIAAGNSQLPLVTPSIWKLEYGSASHNFEKDIVTAELFGDELIVLERDDLKQHQVARKRTSQDPNVLAIKGPTDLESGLAEIYAYNDDLVIHFAGRERALLFMPSLNDWMNTPPETTSWRVDATPLPGGILLQGCNNDGSGKYSNCRLSKLLDPKNGTLTNYDPKDHDCLGCCGFKGRQLDAQTSIVFATKEQFSLNYTPYLVNADGWSELPAIPKGDLEDAGRLTDGTLWIYLLSFENKHPERKLLILRPSQSAWTVSPNLDTVGCERELSCDVEHAVVDQLGRYWVVDGGSIRVIQPSTNDQLTVIREYDHKNSGLPIGAAGRRLLSSFSGRIYSVGFDSIVSIDGSTPELPQPRPKWLSAEILQGLPTCIGLLLVCCSLIEGARARRAIRPN